MVTRYGIYVTPQGALAQTGAAWLGWDIATGRHVAHPVVDGVDIAKITKRPRRYGLHATVKPPMVLAQGATEEALIAATRAVASRLRPASVLGLEVSRISSFLALTPLGDPQPLDEIAATVVEALNAFRAPPTLDELDRRRKHPLTPSQDANLTRWGYPHVMQDYHFHITLTGPLRDGGAALPRVAAHFDPVLPAPFIVDHLTIAGEDGAGMFRTIARLPLGG